MCGAPILLLLVEKFISAEVEEVAEVEVVTLDIEEAVVVMEVVVVAVVILLVAAGAAAAEEEEEEVDVVAVPGEAADE